MTELLLRTSKSIMGILRVMFVPIELASTIPYTLFDGNSPLFRFESAVRSVVVAPPLPSTPWHGAQFDWYAVPPTSLSCAHAEE
jgi:hypothetical protein